jgi:hypothetical protein
MRSSKCSTGTIMVSRCFLSGLLGTTGSKAVSNKPLNLLGSKFNMLTPVLAIRKDGKVFWKCQCDCGAETVAYGGDIKSGRVKSCGCLRVTQKDNWKSYVGEVINNWRCEAYVSTGKIGHVMVWRHTCGNTIEKTRSQIRTGSFARCACLPKPTHKRHRKFDELTRRTHKSMMARCLKPSHPAYLKYGGAGITIDKRWLDYNAFVDDMGLRPEGFEIDRIDNTKGYSKENCRWATRKENLRNTSANRIFIYREAEVCVADLAEIAGIPYHTMWSRLVVRRWDVNKAVTTSVRGRKQQESLK